MAEQCGALGYFDDARRAATGTLLVERAMATGSLVIRKLGATRGEELAIPRFRLAPSVTCTEMLQTLAARTQAAAAGRRIVVAQDTTESNFSGRQANRRGLGPAGDGVSAGFFIHPLIAIDSETGAVLGPLDADIWTRDGKVAADGKRAFEDKESIRWLPGAERAAELLTQAASVVVVGEPGRITTVALRAGPVTFKKPTTGFAKTDPKTVTMTLVEAKAVDPRAGEKPVHWRLLTTIAVDDAAGACEIVRLYRLRWRIEEVFRALKSDGMRLEETQVHAAGRLFKLAVVGLVAACRTIQLVDARDASPRPATDVIDPALLPAAEAIGATLEGKTEWQKNHHPLHSLAWLAWIAAGLGGWNCYYRPPGPKTMRAGWGKFETMAGGFRIATESRGGGQL